MLPKTKLAHKMHCEKARIIANVMLSLSIFGFSPKRVVDDVCGIESFMDS